MTEAVAEAPSRSAGLVIASYNVHGFVGSDGRTDLARTAETIAELDADVVALQEVGGRDPAGVGSPLDYLSERLAMSAVAGVTLTRNGSDFGNALLTRIPIREVRRHDLSVAKREPRGAIQVRVDVAGVGVEITATHLGLKARERRIQAQRLVSLCAAEAARDAPDVALLIGDFNEWRPFAGTLRDLAAPFGWCSRLATFPSRWPLLALDRAFVRPGGALASVQVVASPLARAASDHLPLRVEIALPEVSRQGTASDGARGARRTQPVRGHARQREMATTAMSALRFGSSSISRPDFELM